MGAAPSMPRADDEDLADFGNVAETEYRGAFPRAQLRFGGLGLEVELEAFAPLIPHNLDDSALPVAIFTFRLRAGQPKTVTLLFSWENLLGWGGCRSVAWEDRSGNTHAPVRIEHRMPVRRMQEMSGRKAARARPLQRIKTGLTRKGPAEEE